MVVELILFLVLIANIICNLWIPYIKSPCVLFSKYCPMLLNVIYKSHIEICPI